ncbi:MAG: methylated-DNA--[protein]-cysteine S-methyltransferase [Myxococcales bacterium]
MRYAIGRCSLGALLLAASERGVCALLLGDDDEELVADLERRLRGRSCRRDDAKLEGVLAKAIELVDLPCAAVELPLDVRGTDFQKRVWSALQEVPAGSTTTYAELARAIGAPNAVRAVGSACAANPVAVAIPCHRVLRGDGGLSGYRWGIERKRALLRREARGAAGPER